MICPRWTPRATATLANFGGSSRQASSRLVLFPHACKDTDSRPRRGFSTNGWGDEDGNSGSPSRETPQPLNDAQQTSSRPTATDATGQTSYPLLRRRTRTAATSTVNAAGLDRRPRTKSNHDEPRRPWMGRRDSGGDGAQGESPDIPGQMWPQLQRRERGGKQGYEHVGDAALAIPKSMFSPRQNIQNPQGTKESSLIMLVIDGLSPNLSATDFYRITPTDLSDWQNAIKKVQQQRKPDTFEPLGRYMVTFNTGQAAASYRDRLVRLHKLNDLKLRSASGLWESSVPSSLKVSLASPSAGSETSDAVTSDTPGTESVVDLVNTFTIAPGSQAVLPVQRRKVAIIRPWSSRLAALVENLGYGERPSTLMVDVYPPTLTAEELHQFIRRDGQNRGLRWQVSMPQHLKMSSSEQGSGRLNGGGASKKGKMDEHEHNEVALDKQQNPSFRLNDRETWEKLKGRFVFACADEAEARRFQQSWNHRALTTLRPRPARYTVHASIINW